MLLPNPDLLIFSLSTKTILFFTKSTDINLLSSTNFSINSSISRLRACFMSVSSLASPPCPEYLSATEADKTQKIHSFISPEFSNCNLDLLDKYEHMTISEYKATGISFL